MASEKSLQVQGIIMKQQVMYEKDLQQMNRKERTVCHRICMEQKVLYKRFKTKLHQSQINHAKLMGYKDAEKRLRAKNGNYSFNTNVGNTEEEDILKKIWDAGKVAFDHGSSCERVLQEKSLRQRAKSAPVRRNDPRNFQKISAKRDDETGEIKQEIPPHQRRSNVSIAVPKLEVRPATAFGSNSPVTTHKKRAVRSAVPTRSRPLGQASESSLDTDDSEAIKSVESANKLTSNSSHSLGNSSLTSITEPENSDVTSGNKMSSKRSKSVQFNPQKDLVPQPLERGESRKATRRIGVGELEAPSEHFLQALENDSKNTGNNTENFLQSLENDSKNTTYNIDTAKKKTGVKSKKFRSKSAKASTNKTASSEFHNVWQPTMLDVHRFYAHEANFEGQVEKFCETLKPLKGQTDHMTDYYTLRLQKQAATKGDQRKDNASPEPPPTPESEHRYHLGPGKVRSMTFNHVDYNFSKRPSTYIDVDSFVY